MSLKWYGEKAKAVARKAGIKALLTGAELILTESQKEVPHATGTLLGSGKVTLGWDGAVYVSYDTPYAVKQHEDLSLRHPDPRNPLSTPGRKAKYLEDPFNRRKDKIRRDAQAAVKKALRNAR